MKPGLSGSMMGHCLRRHFGSTWLGTGSHFVAKLPAVHGTPPASVSPVLGLQVYAMLASVFSSCLTDLGENPIYRKTLRTHLVVKHNSNPHRCRSYCCSAGCTVVGTLVAPVSRDPGLEFNLTCLSLSRGYGVSLSCRLSV